MLYFLMSLIRASAGSYLEYVPIYFGMYVGTWRNPLSTVGRISLNAIQKCDMRISQGTYNLGVMFCGILLFTQWELLHSVTRTQSSSSVLHRLRNAAQYHTPR